MQLARGSYYLSSRPCSVENIVVLIITEVIEAGMKDTATGKESNRNIKKKYMYYNPHFGCFLGIIS